MSKSRRRKHQACLYPSSRRVFLTPLNSGDFSTLLSMPPDAFNPRFGWKSFPPKKKHIIAKIKASHKGFRRSKPMIMAVRKKPSGRLLGIVQLRRSSDGWVEMRINLLPRYQDGKAFRKAQKLAAGWCLDHGAKRVWWIS